MHPSVTLDGWHSFALIPAGRAREDTALAEYAVLVDRGLMPPHTPIFVATRRTDAPWPDVRVAVPLSHEEVAAWRHGDRSVARDIVEALEEAYREHMTNAVAGRAT
jgi:hypothetical protein